MTRFNHPHDVAAWVDRHGAPALRRLCARGTLDPISMRFAQHWLRDFDERSAAAAPRPQRFDGLPLRRAH